MTWDFTVGASDIAIVVATLLGPIFAVQAQKYLERGRERDGRRRWVFRTLMMTRATTLSAAHVDALNAVPIEFAGKSPALREIVESWKELLNHLGTDAREPGWQGKREDLFVALLHKMSTYLKYDFGTVELRREIYRPMGHLDMESEQSSVLKGAAAVLKGEKALPMEVRGWPVDAAAAAAQREVQALLLAWLRGDAAPRVRIEDGSQS
jgi:hypothetical protein